MWYTLDGFQSTPPARGATALAHPDAALLSISIHAPREGGDRVVIRSEGKELLFQSTPPARGATPRRR